MTYSFRVSIDQHVLHVISTDGDDVMDTPVESIIIHGGERYDFWVNASDPTEEGLYWIRAENFEYALDKKVCMKDFNALQFKNIFHLISEENQVHLCNLV